MGNAAVKDGRLLHVSASQLNTFEGCKRQWFLDKVVHAPKPPEDPAHFAEGTRLHGQIEKWYEDGTEPADPSCSRLVHDERVPPRDGLGGGLVRVEYPRDYALGLVASGVKIIGRMDLFDARSATHPVIYDWKSAASFDYCADSDELARNTQLLTYARAAFEWNPAVESVTGVHGYVLKQPKPPKPAHDGRIRVVATEPMDRAHVENFWHSSVVPRVEAMTSTARLTDPNDVEPNFGHCWKYGRKSPCAYVSICREGVPMNPADYLPGAARKKMDPFDLLFGATTTNSTPPPVAATPPPTFPYMAAVPAPVVSPSARYASINPPDAAEPVYPPLYQPYVPPPESAS